MNATSGSMAEASEWSDGLFFGEACGRVIRGIYADFDLLVGPLLTPCVGLGCITVPVSDCQALQIRN